MDKSGRRKRRRRRAKKVQESVKKYVKRERERDLYFFEPNFVREIHTVEE